MPLPHVRILLAAQGAARRDTSRTRCAQHITHLHAAIRSALDAFAAEAAALRGGGALTAGALAALVERHRFVRAVCAFHSASENDVVFPAARCACKPPQVAGVSLPWSKDRILHASKCF